MCSRLLHGVRHVLVQKINLFLDQIPKSEQSFEFISKDKKKIIHILAIADLISTIPFHLTIRLMLV